jgi:crotonobetainyl-CoA:carnitine CoA-transferase CaiB-like acyl-CoA transferase
VIAIYQVFDTADGQITLGIGNDRIFQRFCEAIGRHEWAREERYSTNARRRAAREELVSMIQEVLRHRTCREWLELFLVRGVPAGPIYGVESLLEDPHLRQRGLLYAIPSDRGPIPQVGSGWRLEGRPNGYSSPPPRLGEHSEAVLSGWLGDD